MPLVYGYVCLYFKRYTCTFICKLSNPSSLLTIPQKTEKMEVFGFGSQTGNQGTGPGACDILRGLKTNHKI